MKNKIIKKFIILFSLGFILLGLNFTNTNAEETLPPTPLECIAPQILNEIGDACVDVVVEPTPEPVPLTTLSIDTEVDVPITCEVLDTDNVAHTYTASSSNSYLGICALKVALDLKSISNVKLSNKYPSMGLFVTSFNKTEANPDSQYWALYQNNGYTDFGISTLPISAGDIVSFKLSDFAGHETGDSVVIRIRSLVVTNTNQNSGSGGGSSFSTLTKTFSTSKALEFLVLNQGEDGSFGNSLYTDWVAIGIAKTNEEKTDDLKSSISNYIKTEKFEGVSITDYERHAMALMALGINPYDGTDINYISKIVNSFDGEQIGDKSLVNDDIFGLIVLQNAGYDKNDEIILKTISNILKSQSSDGSWGSVDMTSAGIMALNNFKNVNGVNDSIAKAFKFIKKNEKDGNYGNVFSTSWAMQAFSLRDYYSDEVSRTLQFLAYAQDNEDGFIKVDGKDNQIWATAYSIPAVLKMSWTEIMESFPRQEIELIKETIPPILTVNKKANVEVLQTLNPETISSNSDTNNISIDGNDSNIKNLFKNKIIIMTIILTLVTFIGGWFVIKF